MDIVTEKQAVGQSVSRTEDPRLLEGRGRYSDDINLTGQAHAYILRAPQAHGIIREIDLSSAQSMPGVVAIYTGADLQAAGYGPLPCMMAALKSHDGSPIILPENPALAIERVRYLGHPVVAVIAETVAQAKDAAEAIGLDIEELPAIDTVEAAIASGAPLVWPDIANNTCLDFQAGDFEAVAAAFDRAAHISRLKIYNNRLVVAAEKNSELRYGENPHQQAAFYTTGSKRPGVATARQIQGKALSYNNLNDTDAAFELVGEFDPSEAAVAIIKHANPCGVAIGTDILDAYQKALRCDPVSAFGGIISTNRPLDGAAAAAMVEIFTEVIIAPDADEAARTAIAAKKNLRLLLTGGLPDAGAEGMTLKSLAGGYLLQSRDSGRIGRDDVQVVSKRAPSDQEMADLLLAFRICKHVKSNAIIYVKDGATVGIGAGQMSRVDSARIAARKSEDAAQALGQSEPLAKGSVVASDAFFPFADGLLAAAEAGATAVIQPGGSMRDNEVIAAADEAGLAMVMTGMRHFRH